MSKQLITDEVVQGAFDYLHDDSRPIASARANLIRAEYQVKRIHAKLFLAATGTIEARKAWATAHDDYAEAQERLAIAEGVWEQQKDQRNRATMILEAWRTEQASRRVVDRIR